MLLAITPFYAGILGLFYIILTLRVVKVRLRTRVYIGDGQNESLLRASRVHANFAEYAPITLLLLAFAELQGAPLWLMHVLGLTFVFGRMIHATGLSREPETLDIRKYGMYLTLTTLMAAAFLCIALSVITFVDKI